MADEDLKDAFQRLKRMDESVTPEFERASDNAVPHWQWRPGAIGVAGSAVILALFFLTQRPSTESPTTPEIVASDPFEEYSEAISRELFASAEIHWESRSDFLLDFDTELTEP